MQVGLCIPYESDSKLTGAWGRAAHAAMGGTARRSIVEVVSVVGTYWQMGEIVSECGDLAANSKFQVCIIGAT